jgi:hypothetical protein
MSMVAWIIIGVLAWLAIGLLFVSLCVSAARADRVADAARADWAADAAAAKAAADVAARIAADRARHPLPQAAAAESRPHGRFRRAAHGAGRSGRAA